VETETLKSRAKAPARLGIEQSGGWTSPSSPSLWGGDACSAALPLSPLALVSQICGGRRAVEDVLFFYAGRHHGERATRWLQENIKGGRTALQVLYY
jgi:hypothetical protein